MAARHGLDSDFKCVLELWEPLARACYHSLQSTVLSVPLERRAERMRGGISGFPRWCEVQPQLANVEVVPPPRVDDTLGALQEDAERSVNFIMATRKLRVTREAPKTLREIITSIWPESQAEPLKLQSRLPTLFFYARHASSSILK